jgi:cytochrome c2
MMTRRQRIAFRSSLSSGAAVAAAALYLLPAGNAVATPKYGAATGQPCSACHVRPDGGPELTPFGKQFESNGDRLKKP